MILDKDLEFHPTDPQAHNWAETNYFAFFIPEHAICGHLQALFRPNVGAVMSDVRIWRGLMIRGIFLTTRICRCPKACGNIRWQTD